MLAALAEAPPKPTDATGTNTCGVLSSRVSWSLLLSFIQLTKSFDPERLRLTLKAEADPGFKISDLDMPQGPYFLTLISTFYSLPYSESES